MVATQEAIGKFFSKELFHFASVISQEWILRKRMAGKGGIFLQLGQASTLIRQENGAFCERSSNRRNLKTPAFRVCVDGKYFKNGAFRKRGSYDNHVISLTEFSSNKNPK